MPTGAQFPAFDLQFHDHSGTRAFPAAGYSLYQYISGTTTNQNTYTDDALTAANTHPILLDAAGRCVMFADPTLSYTFVLKDTDGVTIETWDDVVAGTIPTSGDYLPLTGGTMTGYITLHANATANLHPVPKQQLDSSITAALASMQALVDAATAAAAAATAAAAAIAPTVFVLPSSSGGAVSQDVDLAIGVYWVCLITTVNRPDSGTYDFSATQAATVGGTTLGTTIALKRGGGAGYDRVSYGVDMDVGTLTVATAATYTMAMAAASLVTATAKGSVLIVAKQP